MHTTTHPILVSIPFKRESVFRGLISDSKDKTGSCFNSLQTGKCIQSHRAIRKRKVCRNTFQFPSNGKVYSEAYAYAASLTAKDPACFNSLQTGKCIQSQLKRNIMFNNMNRFNSLQTGKCIQRPIRNELLATVEPIEPVFQFPSNGKVYSESTSTMYFNFNWRSFNSLQTGKCIQRRWSGNYNPYPSKFQFPSNGKVYSEENHGYLFSDNGAICI